MISVNLYFLLFYALLALHTSTECFMSCGLFDNCNSDRCQGVCGENGAVFSQLAFTAVSCKNEGDLCVYREFIFAANQDGLLQTSTAIPGGCLLEYEHNIVNERRFFFNNGTNLFTCEGDFCNKPPIDKCDIESARNRRDGNDQVQNCAFIENDQVNLDMFSFQPIRAGNFETIRDRRDFCIINETFRQFDSSSECFGFTGVGFNSESDCVSIADNLTEIIPTFCVDCTPSENCSPNDPTPPPTRGDPQTNAPAGSNEEEEEEEEDDEEGNEEENDEEENDDEESEGGIDLILVVVISSFSLILMLFVVTLLVLSRLRRVEKELDETHFIDNKEVVIVKPKPQMTVNEPPTDTFDSIAEPPTDMAPSSSEPGVEFVKTIDLDDVIVKKEFANDGSKSTIITHSMTDIL